MLKSGDRANRTREVLEVVDQVAVSAAADPGVAARTLTRSPMT